MRSLQCPFVWCRIRYIGSRMFLKWRDLRTTCLKDPYPRKHGFDFDGYVNEWSVSEIKDLVPGEKNLFQRLLMKKRVSVSSLNRNGCGRIWNKKRIFSIDHILDAFGLSAFRNLRSGFGFFLMTVLFSTTEKSLLGDHQISRLPQKKPVFNFSKSDL